MESVVTKINKFIEFTPEQKERAATVDLEEFLLRQGEKLIKSGREKRLASDHSVTVRGCEWFDHTFHSTAPVMKSGTLCPCSSWCKSFSHPAVRTRKRAFRS